MTKKERGKKSTGSEKRLFKREKEQSKETEEKYLTAGTELMFICCGWLMGEGARAPMGAWDICAFCIAIGLNWLIPVGAGTQLFTCLLYLGVVI